MFDAVYPKTIRSCKTKLVTTRPPQVHMVHGLRIANYELPITNYSLPP
jgi:hypothetical protein